MPLDHFKTCSVVVALLLIDLQGVHSQTSQPEASYIFPAGAQRGQTVDITVGGLFLLDDPWFEMLGSGVQAFERLRTGETVWFEGPILTGAPARGPDFYPRDHQGLVTIAGNALLGGRPWRVWTSQGATAARVFVIGDLPEVVEREIDGDPVPIDITVPVTANGRIFPRADLDIWTFDASRGETYTIELHAKSILSPLDARIVVHAAGEKIADDIGTKSVDPVIQFQAQNDGRHEIHVHDVGYAGTQACVYRLTVRQGLRTAWVYPLGGRRGAATEFEVGLRPNHGLAEPNTTSVTLDLSADQGNFIRKPLTITGRRTEPVRLEISDMPERLEVEPNNAASGTVPLAAPVMLNGRINSAGDVDVWPIAALAGQPLELRLSAGRLGSHLEPDLEIVDSNGTVLAPNEAQPVKENTPSSDRYLVFKPAQDGIYWVRVKDRFPSRGGPEFGYRLQAGSAAPGYGLSFDNDAITAVRGTEASLTIHVERFGGLTGPIAIDVDGLPAETELSGLEIPADKDEVTIKIKPSETAPIGGHRLQFRGTHSDGGRTITEVATKTLANSGEAVDSVLLSVSIATPFKFNKIGPYYAFANAGGVFRYPFGLERGDYEGPITVRVADRQRRHLQGVTDAGEFVIPPGADRFDFPFYLPPGMSRDRLGRPLIMGIGEIVDEQGNRHQVAYTDGETAQAPLRVRAGRLGVVAKQTSVYIQQRSVSEIEFEVQRGDAKLNLPATVEVMIPDHISGLDAAAVTLAPDEHLGSLSLQVGPRVGPLNMPLTLRVTVIENGDRVVGESLIAVVAKDPDQRNLAQQSKN
jgi:hypothetical protein